MQLRCNGDLGQRFVEYPVELSIKRQLLERRGDGVCNELEIAGCTDPEADSYMPQATEDDGSCLYFGCTASSACNYDPTANYNDGTCDYESCVGCGNEAACNYDPAVTYSTMRCVTLRMATL